VTDSSSSATSQKLEREVAKLKKINAALIKRVERDMDRQDAAFSLFQAATAPVPKPQLERSSVKRA